MSLSAVTVLLVFTLTSPGPLDQFGGHVNIMNGQYHTHSGSSYQTRYVDITERIWTGNGPRPEEYLIFTGADNFDLFDQQWFIFLASGFIISAIVIGLDIRKRLGYGQYHRRVVAWHEKWPAMARPTHSWRDIARVMPAANALPPWSGPERRGLERRGAATLVLNSG